MFHIANDIDSICVISYIIVLKPGVSFGHPWRQTQPTQLAHWLLRKVPHGGHKMEKVNSHNNFSTVIFKEFFTVALSTLLRLTVSHFLFNPSPTPSLDF